MRISLFAHDANPSIDRPLCYESWVEIIRLLEEGRIELLKDSRGREYAAQFKTIPAHTLQAQLRELAIEYGEIEGVARWYDGPVGVGNILGFARIQNPKREPERHHYNIPALGDHRLRWLLRFLTPEKRPQNNAVAS